jgi:hypothetical protein
MKNKKQSRYSISFFWGGHLFLSIGWIDEFPAITKKEIMSGVVLNQY